MAWLTKSRFLSGLQCPKRLWREVHAPLAEELPVTAPILNGRAFDELVRRLRPGTVVSRERGMPSAIAATERLRLAGLPAVVHQPAFRSGDFAVIADMLSVREGNVTLTEVKSSTSVKPEHLSDITYQALVLRKAGFAVDRMQLAHIDRTFTLRTPGDFDGLIAEVDVTTEVEAALPGVAEAAAQLKGVMQLPLKPAIRTGAQCETPYPCPFFADCTAEEGNRVQPAPKRLTRDKRLLVDAAAASGQPEFNAAATRELRTLAAPFAYLDFETIGLALPEVPGTHPYDQWPFQWSVHVEDAAGATRHAEYLAAGDLADVAPLATALIAALPADGPVFAYNAAFENAMLLKLADYLPAEANALRDIAARLYDLLPVTRKAWYHADMQGSWSIKAVLPTIAPELDYAQLAEVRDGDGAQAAFLQWRDAATSPGRKAALRAALLRYCERDTWGLVVLRRFLTR
jgi:hypothetical protein